MHELEQFIAHAPETYQLLSLIAYTIIAGGIGALIVHSDKGSENFNKPENLMRSDVPPNFH